MREERLTDKMRVLEYERQATLTEIIGDLVDQQLTDDEIAENLGIARLTLYDWLERLNLKIARYRQLRMVEPSPETDATPVG